MGFDLTLPIPPSVNSLSLGRNKGIRATAYRAWLDEAGWRMNEARAKGLWKPLKAECWYWTDLRLPHAHLGDSDNRLKALHDLLVTMGATPDDKWLMGGTYMRCHDVAPGTCRVWAESFPSGQRNDWEQIKLLADRMSRVTP